ncbi:hypothetical protein D3C86_2269050 [compost metagenome]
MTDAWVGQAVEDIHDEVDQDHQAGDQQDAVLDHGVVTGTDGFDQPLADARPGKDGFGQDRTGQ